MCKKDLKNFSTEVSFSNIDNVNQEFAKAKVRVCYAGRNRNRTDFAKETLDKMSKTIYGIPVVGEYISEEDDFGGHGGKVEISDKGIEFVDTTVPYGFVDPSTPVFYEKVMEKDGLTEKEYLTCYAYLWYKRYPQLETLLKNGMNQSMEVSVDKGHWDEDDYYVIEDATFSALCILGTNVEPCFESANISTRFSLDGLDDKYKEMISAFKKYTLENIGEGAEKMDKEFENQDCEVEVEAEVIEHEEAETISDDVEEVVVCEKEEEEEKEEVEEIEEVACESSDEIEEVIEEESANYETLCVELTNQLSEANKTIESLNSELGELREFKAERLAEIRCDKEKELFEKFEMLNGDVDFEEIKSNASKYSSLEELEKDIALVYAKRTLSFSMKKKEETSLKIKVEKDVDIKDDVYGGLLSKYGKKE